MFRVTEAPLAPDEQKALWQWLSSPGRRIYQRYLVGRACVLMAEAAALTVDDRDINAQEKNAQAIDYLRLNTLLELHTASQIAFTAPDIGVKNPSEAVITTNLT